MSSIAIFSTYAPSEGFGGPARIFHERRALETAGHRVTHVVLRADHTRVKLRPADFARTVERRHGTPIDHIYHDVDLGNHAAADQRLIDSISAHLREASTDIVLLEQPFLVAVAIAVADRLGARIVYSSQNLEYVLRRDLEQFQPDPARRADRWAEVRELEARAVSAATLVTTICPTDRDLHHAEFGCDSVVVPNGTAIADLPPAAGRSTASTVDFAFAGSTYWPNLEGFSRVATPSLAFLPPDVRIHVAGSVGPHLLSVPQIARHHSVNAARIAIRGFLDIHELASVLAAARAVLVPVFIGEGSNLKSADALASGSPVIMTRRAIRGYEDVIGDDPEGVVIVDSATDFREAMSAALGSAAERAAVGRERRALLRWDRRLAPLSIALGRLT